MSRSLPPDPSLEHLRKQAKSLLRAARSRDAEALRAIPGKAPDSLRLADAQRTVARTYGFDDWSALKAEVALRRADSSHVHDHVAALRRLHALAEPLIDPVRVDARLSAEAEVLVAAHEAGDPVCATPLRLYLPKFRHFETERILARPLSEAEARDVMAQAYIFSDWAACTKADRLIDPEYERAVDAITVADVAALERTLARRPDLVHARSPFGHESTLLHYAAANGVEIRRQKTPARIAEIVRALLAAGASVDASSNAYGGDPGQTTLCLTVSSEHPAARGVQGEIVEALLDGGAAIEGVEDDGRPLSTALAFGFQETAEVLVRRGARVRNIVVACGLGRLDLLADLVDVSDQRYVDPSGRAVTDRQELLDRALMLSARLAHPRMARLLLDAGADVKTREAHGRTALHWAAHAGHQELSEMLVARGADPQARETYHRGTPADWARATGHDALAAILEGS